MAVDFDPDKDAANRAKHGVGLDRASILFEGDFVEREVRRADLAEQRFLAIGPIPEFDGKLFIVIYTWRHGRRRIISLRRANDREARAHRERHGR